MTYSRPLHLSFPYSVLFYPILLYPLHSTPVLTFQWMLYRTILAWGPGPVFPLPALLLLLFLLPLPLPLCVILFCSILQPPTPHDVFISHYHLIGFVKSPRGRTSPIRGRSDIAHRTALHRTHWSAPFFLSYPLAVYVSNQVRYGTVRYSDWSCLPYLIHIPVLFILFFSSFSQVEVETWLSNHSFLLNLFYIKKSKFEQIAFFVESECRRSYAFATTHSRLTVEDRLKD